MTQQNPRTETLSDYGLSSANNLVNRDRLLYRLYSSHNGTEEEIQAIIRVLSDNPDRDKDKKPIMRKSGHESTIKETTGQGLGSAIDNMPYYVDSCSWWIKGWDSDKYIASLRRRGNKYKAVTVGMDNINPRTGLVRTRRKQIPRRIRSRL